MWLDDFGVGRDDHYCARNHFDLNFNDDIKHHLNDDHHDDACAYSNIG
jgi:hypothetical protein